MYCRYTQILLLVLCGIIFSCKAQSNLTIKEKKFAEFHNSDLIIIGDTIALKKSIFNNVNFSKPLTLDRVEIIEQLTLEAVPQEFYYLVLRDTKQHIKFARWLVKRDNSLYLNTAEDGNNFEKTFIVCSGKDDCSPEVFVIENERFWGCSKDSRCLTVSPDPALVTCKTATFVFLSE